MKIPPLFKHQAQTKALLKKHDIFFDQSEPGTGKTRVQIEDVDTSKPTIILATRSTLDSAWAEDFRKFAPQLQLSVAYANNRAKAFATPADVYITNHDAVNWLAVQDKKFWKKFEGGTIINDESCVFKHNTAQRSKSAAKIAKYFARRRNLSGLADPNGICDLWHQYFILDEGKRLGKSFFGFRSATCTPMQVGPMPNMIKWVERKGIANVVAALIKDITIKHLFEDCVDIPPNHQYTRAVKLNRIHREQYNEMQDDMITLVKGKAISAINKAVLRVKLLQIACICYDTPVLTERGWIRIQNVLKTDRVWDGEEWVTHSGSQLKGATNVIKRHGVWMTPEHLVLTKEGWKDGQCSEKFDRADVRLPNSYPASRNSKQMCDMGDLQGAKQQHPSQHTNQNAERYDDYQAGRRDLRNQTHNTACSTSPLRLDDTTRTEPVYDLINCGPRTRFVVMDENGEPLIVHNSGAAYNSEETGYTRFETDRYELVLDLVQECAHSVVFFQWTHQRDELVKEAKKRGLTFAVFDGSTSDKERALITERFQAGEYACIFAHPKSAAHGLTWVKGTRTIWASPSSNLEWYQQGLKRIYRIGQTQKTETITVIAEETYDELEWERLTGKVLRSNEFTQRLKEYLL